MARTAFIITITGQVQGVGYRAFVRRNAVQLGLDGWVRNRADGAVEVYAVGEPETVQELIDACNDRGPAAAKLEEMSLRGAEDDGTKGFKQKPTAPTD